MLFLSQPLGTGFSYSDSEIGSLDSTTGDIDDGEAQGRYPTINATLAGKSSSGMVYEGIRADCSLKILRILLRELLGKSCRDLWGVCRNSTLKSSPSILTYGRKVTEGKQSLPTHLKDCTDILKALWTSCELYA